MKLNTGHRTASSMRKFGGYLSVLGVLMFPGFCRPIVAQTAGTSTQVFADAYVALVQADQARDQEAWKDAQAAYRGALDKFQQLTREFPEWEPSVVQYRIVYCENQLSALSGKVNDAKVGTPGRPAAPGVPSAEFYQQKYRALMEENRYLHQRLAKQEEALEFAELRASDTNTLEQLHAEAEKLRLERDSLNRKLSHARKQIEAVTELRKKVEDLEREKKDLEDSLLKVQAERDSLKKRLASTTIFKLVSYVEPAGEPGKAARQKKNDANNTGWLEKGLLAERQGQYAEALSAYEKAGSAEPESADVLLGKARCLLNLGKMDDAQAVVKGLLKKEPGNAEACNIQGALWMGQGRMVEARAELEKALELNPKLSDAHINLAQVLCVLDPDNREKARRHYRQAIELGVRPEPELEKMLGLP